MKKALVILIILIVNGFVYSQVPEFDRLEMYYAQGHYKLVHRKANRLLDQPDYDYSLLPTFYKSLSLFQLSQNKHWLVRNSTALNDAEKLFLNVRRSADGSKVLSAHIHEVSALKKDLMSWAEDLKRTGDKDTFDHLQKIMQSLFKDVPDLHDVDSGPTVDPSNPSEPSSKEREELVNYAKKQLGVPYVWSGDDPSGFDCSGFTSFVFKSAGVTLPRRAVDQYQGSKKLKEKTVQKGDLIFFDNGSGISHVGIVISDKGKPIMMIHSSSSKGIVVTDIESSDYWKSRVYGYGAYLN